MKVIVHCHSATGALFALAIAGLLQSIACFGAEPALPVGAAAAQPQKGRLVARIGQKTTGFAVSCFAAAPDADVVALGSDDGNIRLWSLAESKVTRTIDLDNNTYIGAMAFSLDGKQLAFHEDDEPIRLWDMERMSEAARTKEAYSFVEHLSISPTGKLVAAISDGEGLVWSVDSGKAWKSDQPVSALAFSPDGQTLALGFNTVRLVDAASGKSVRDVGKIESRVTRLQFSPAGSELLVVDGSCPGAFVRVFDRQSENEQVLGEKIRSDSVSAAYSPDGQRIAVSDGTGDATFWDTAAGRKLYSLPGIDRYTSVLAFSRDGKWLLTGRNDTVSEVLVWELAADPPTGQPAVK